ncbi:MAG: KEOPS complex subunit Cgi121 [Methanomicrobiales archaeon]|nr:KEOPS complex subunit Cgi121 [Methanomicrobiales archaeon]
MKEPEGILMKEPEGFLMKEPEGFLMGGAFGIRQAVFTVGDPARFLDRLRRLGARYRTRIVCLDADRLAGQAHARAAIRAALRSVATGNPIANTLEMEVLLYAAGSRQCSVATRFGIHEGRNTSYVILAPPEEAAWDALAGCMEFVEEDWDRITGKKRRWLAEAFGITDEELAAAGGADRFRDLVLERVALLDVSR